MTSDSKGRESSAKFDFMLKGALKTSNEKRRGTNKGQVMYGRTLTIRVESGKKL